LREGVQAAPATIEKLRWLLAKATFAFGEARCAIADVCLIASR